MSDPRAARQRAAETKRQRSRAAILEAATRLFEEHGWLPTTVDSIAAEAGVGVATVYNHFPNKNVIAGLVFLPVVDDLIKDPRWSDEAVPAPEALGAFVEDLVYRVRKRVRLTIALLEAVNDSTARHGTRITEDDPRYWVPLPPVFSMIIGRGQSNGDFLDYPPARDAGPFFSNMLLLRVLTRPEESATATTRLILTVLMRTFGVPDPGRDTAGASREGGMTGVTQSARPVRIRAGVRGPEDGASTIEEIELDLFLITWEIEYAAASAEPAVRGDADTSRSCRRVLRDDIFEELHGNRRQEYDPAPRIEVSADDAAGTMSATVIVAGVVAADVESITVTVPTSKAGPVRIPLTIDRTDVRMVGTARPGGPIGEIRFPLRLEMTRHGR